MWSQLILLLRARRALRAERFEAALSLLDDPTLRRERRAQELRREALAGMLGRARHRLEAGHLDVAGRDLDRLLQLDPELPGCSELGDRLRDLRGRQQERQQQEQQLRTGFERALDHGRLQEARDLLKAMRGRLGDSVADDCEARLVDRRRQASRLLKQVREALDHGRRQEARQSLDQARRLCADSVAFRERLVGLSAAWAKERWQEVGRALSEGRSLDAARALAEWWNSDPDSNDLEEARDLLLGVADRIARDAQAFAERGAFDEALQLVAQVPAPVAGVSSIRWLKERLEQVGACLEAEDDDPRRRLQVLARILAETRWPAIEARIGEVRQAVQELDAGLQRAREALAHGRIEDGKVELDGLLGRWAGCDEARALMEGLLADEREREAQLRAARQALRDGKLLEAQRHLLRLVTGGFGAEEARGLLRDVERLRAKVTREATALSARLDASADPDEVLRQVERLAATQKDSPDLMAVEARARRLAVCHGLARRLKAAVDGKDSAACVAVLREWVGGGETGGPVGDERALLAVAGADLERSLREELLRGDPSFVCDLAQGLRPWQAVLGIDVEPCLSEALERVEEARSQAAAGLELLAGKRLDEARAALDRARELAPNEPQVLRLLHRLRGIERGRGELERALALADSDPAAARDKLQSLGPTPRPLGSMVLRVRDKVDRQGDLDSGCLLRVEEGGEYLLFCEDRLRIGNANGQSFPHIPVLAKIKSHHATLVRTVTFHGGVKDSVEPGEGAEVTVAGAAAPADLKHGDRLLLGGVLPITYLRPSPRSASSLLRLEKGFESRGTTRILWVRPGGREGRILIGRGQEVHVRVGDAEPELYLYAPGKGRLFVSFRGEGTIDGAPFTGDRELACGASVVCGKIAFRILPL